MITRVLTMLLLLAPATGAAQPARDPLLARLLELDRAAAIRAIAAQPGLVEHALDQLKRGFDASVHSARDVPEQRLVRYDTRALDDGLALGGLYAAATGDDRVRRAFAARQRRVEGTTLLNERKYAEALVALEDALSEAQRLDDVWLQLITRINLAYGLLETGQTEAALRACEEARVLADRSDPRARALAVFNLASVQMHARRFEEAIPLAAEAATLAQQLGNRLWEGNARLNLGVAHFELEHAEDARRELTRARDVLLTTKDQLGIGRSRYNLALLAASSGELAEAIGEMERALPLIRTVDIRHSHAIEQDPKAYYNPFEEAALQLLEGWHTQMGNTTRALDYGRQLAALRAKKPEKTGHTHKPGR